MKSRWSDTEAREFTDRYAPAWGEPLALRVYTSRLIGKDPDLAVILGKSGGHPAHSKHKDNPQY